MNFKVSFDEDVTLPKMFLVVNYIILFFLFLVLILYFIDYEFPNGRYFRAVFSSTLLILVSAYFNKETK